MNRYALIKDGVVVNAVEYAEQPEGTPPGFEEGTVAVLNSTSGPGWCYADGVFTNPNPIVEVFPL